MALTARNERGSTKAKSGRKPWSPIRPTDPTRCTQCGTPRPRRTLPDGFGESWAPTIGTAWETHSGAMTCSAECRRLAGLPPTPFDADGAT